MNAKHAGKIESWIESRAKSRRGYGHHPKHARPGRHAAAPSGYALRAITRKGGEFYGWTRESIVRAARVA